MVNSGYDLGDLTRKTEEYSPMKRLSPIEEAFDFAARSHDGQLRKSGEPFVHHPLQTAMILAELLLDAAAIAAGLLHNVREDSNVPGFRVWFKPRRGKPRKDEIASASRLNDASAIPAPARAEEEE